MSRVVKKFIASSSIDATKLDTATSGSDNQVLTKDSSASSGFKWANVTSAVSFPFSSITSTYTAQLTDYTLGLSGASFTLTLPTAVGNSGKIFKIIHNGTNLTQVYTLNTTSGQTIGGILSGNYALYTTGEVLTVVSDGSNWLILEHVTNATWTVSGITIGATSVAPTKATTREYDRIEVERAGRYANLTYRYSAANATGSVAGNGIYLFSLPNSLAVDTTLQPTTSSSTTNGIQVSGSITVPATCSLYSTTGPGGAFAWFVSMYTSTQFFVHYQQAGSLTENNVGSGAFPLTQIVGYRITIKVPILGWQP